MVDLNFQSDQVIHDLKADLPQKQQPTTKLVAYKTYTFNMKV